jgi:hypothetical protein
MKTALSFVLVSTLFAGVVAACSSTTTVTDTDAGTTAADSGTTVTDSSSPQGDGATGTDATTGTDGSKPGNCTSTGLTVVASDGFVKSDGTVGVFQQNTLSAPVDTIEIDLLPLTGNAVTIGKRTLTTADASYADCKTCILIRTKCDDALANCAKTFMAQSGTLDLTTFGGKGSALKATVDAVLAEVTIDKDLKTTVVPGGETWCLTAHKVDVTKLQ